MTVNLGADTTTLRIATAGSAGTTIGNGYHRRCRMAVLTLMQVALDGTDRATIKPTAASRHSAVTLVGPMSDKDTCRT